MLFNSISFLIFFPIVTLLYFSLPHGMRWALLLFASCIFYAAFIPAYLLILLLTIVIDYYAALFIDQTRGGKKKLYLLIASITSTCSILFVFKYFNFFNSNVMVLAHYLGWQYSVNNLSLILPIGLSFHTFQSLSYVIEVYRGNQKPEKHFGIYALYVMFYPQLVAGPIERPQNLLHQFREKHSFDYSRCTDALRLMLWGFFKKVVVADNLAEFVNKVYNSPGDYSGNPEYYILATVFFAFQIYFDFSGYTDIARGAARMMGFELMLNFDSPYFSKSISEFWRKWHISLSTWFRDYVYIPLGGSRIARHQVYFNLLITFLLSGIWHGANWTFVVWGLLNGAYIICGDMTKGWLQKISAVLKLERIRLLIDPLRILFTFSLICLAWVFFRANQLSDALLILRSMAVAIIDVRHGTELAKNLIQIASTNALAIYLLTFMFLAHFMKGWFTSEKFRNSTPLPVRWAGYYAFSLGILFLGVFTHKEFIYFQF